jgi:hypothetical protein
MPSAAARATRVHTAMGSMPGCTGIGAPNGSMEGAGAARETAIQKSRGIGGKMITCMLARPA